MVIAKAIKQLNSSKNIEIVLTRDDDHFDHVKVKADFVNNQKAELTSLPFVFRIKLNLEKMLDKETTLLDIKTKFI